MSMGDLINESFHSSKLYQSTEVVTLVINDRFLLQRKSDQNPKECSAFQHGPCMPSSKPLPGVGRIVGFPSP